VEFLITAMIASLSEGLFTPSAGSFAEVFLETVNKALFQSPFIEMYGKIMLTPPEKPGPRCRGREDMRLFRERRRRPGADAAGGLFMATFHRAFGAG